MKNLQFNNWSAQEGSANKSINTLYVEIKYIIEEGKNNAFRAVNAAKVQTYWHIGKVIIENEQNGSYKADNGEALLDRLSVRLTKEFGRNFRAEIYDIFVSFSSYFQIGTHCVPNCLGSIIVCY